MFKHSCLPFCQVDLSDMRCYINMNKERLLLCFVLQLFLLSFSLMSTPNALIILTLTVYACNTIYSEESYAMFFYDQVT